MEVSDVQTAPASKPKGEPSIKGQVQGSSCAGNACPFSNSYGLAFLLPFMFVSAFCLLQQFNCAPGQTACAFSAVAVGALAGATSLGLFAAIKKVQAFRKAKTDS